MEKIKILALFGQSGAGKDTILRWLLDQTDFKLHKIIPYTSRPIRDTETPDENYHFVTREEFEQMINRTEILECSCFNNWYYGTAINDLSKNYVNIGVFNPTSIRALLSNPNIEILPIWIYANGKTRLMRSLQRENNPDCKEICRRFIADESDFAHLDDICYLQYDNGYEKTSYEDFVSHPSVKSFLKVRNV